MIQCLPFEFQMASGTRSSNKHESSEIRAALPAPSVAAPQKGTKRLTTSPAQGPAPVSPAYANENAEAVELHHLNHDTDNLSDRDNLSGSLSPRSHLATDDNDNNSDRDPTPFDTDLVPFQDTDDILNHLIQENYSSQKSEEHLAPPVADLLASTMDDWSLKVPEKNEIKLAFEQCKIPVNVKSLGPIRINDIIYQRIPFKAKELDRQSKNQSAYYTRAMGPLTFIWDCFIKSQAWAIKNKRELPKINMQDKTISIRELTACLSSSIKLLCYHHALNLQRRKSLLHQHLDPKYFSLASPSNPVTDLLFGDNLEQRVSDIFKVSQAAKNARFQPARPRFRSGGHRGQGHSNYFQRRYSRSASYQFKRSRSDKNRNSSSWGNKFKRARNRFRQNSRGRPQFQHQHRN